LRQQGQNLSGPLKKFMDNLSLPITLGSFVRLKGENIRYLVIKIGEDGASLLRTYNRDPKKWYVEFSKLEEIIPVEVPKIRVAIFKEAFQNFFEKHGNFWFDNLTYIEILGKLL
jgi:hypothetical protein